MIDAPFIYQYGNLKPFKKVRMKSTIDASYKTQLDSNQFTEGSTRINMLNADKLGDYVISFEFIIDRESKDDYNDLQAVMNGEPQIIYFLQFDSDPESKNPVKLFYNRGSIVSWTARKEDVKAINSDTTIIDCSVRLMSPKFYLMDDQDSDLIDYNAIARLKYDDGLKYDTDGFLPSDLSNLVAHYDLSDIDTLTLDSFNKVSQINDKVGSNHIIQADTTKQPVYTQSLFGSRPAVQFDGTKNQEMEFTSDIVLSGAYTIFTVVRADLVDGAARAYLGNDGVFLQGYNNYTLAARSVNTAGSAGSIPWTTDINPTLTTLTRTSSDIVSASLNNSGANAGLTPLYSSNPQPGDLQIKAFGSRGGGFRWTGGIAEMIVYDKHLSQTERDQIHNYIFRKYNLKVDNFTPPSKIPNRYDSLEVSTTRYLSSLNTEELRDAFKCGDNEHPNEKTGWLVLYNKFQLRIKDRFFERKIHYKYYNQLKSNFDLSDTGWLKVNCEINPEYFDTTVYPDRQKDVDDLHLRYCNRLTVTNSNTSTQLRQDNVFFYRGDNMFRFKIKNETGTSDFFQISFDNIDGAGLVDLPITSITSGVYLGNGWYEHKILFNCIKETYFGVFYIKLFANSLGNIQSSAGDAVCLKDLQIYNPTFTTETPLESNVCGNVISPCYNGQNTLTMVAKENNKIYHKQTVGINHKTNSNSNIMIIAINKMQKNDHFEIINESNNTGFRFWWLGDLDSPECMLYYPHKEELYDAKNGNIIPFFKNNFFIEHLERGNLEFRILNAKNNQLDTDKYDVLRLYKIKFSGQSLQIMIKILNNYI